MPKIYKVFTYKLNRKVYRGEKRAGRNIAKEKFKRLKTQSNRKIRQIHRQFSGKEKRNSAMEKKV